MPEFTPPPIYWVEWTDSTTTRGWVRPDDLSDTDLRCWTTGFLVGEDDESVTIAASLSSYGGFCDPMTIPRVAITLIREVVFDD